MDPDWGERTKSLMRGSETFAVLDEQALNDLVALLEFRSVAAGSVVFRDNDVAEHMVIVISGRLRVWRQGGDGALLLYNELVPGDVLGETAMILRQNRPASVTALRDSRIATLSREGFESLLARHPVAVNRVFSHAIFNYLRHTAEAPDRRVTQSFAVVPLDERVDAVAVAEDLRSALEALGPAHHLHLREFEGQTLAGADLDAAIRQLDALEGRFEFLVYELDDAPSEWTRQAAGYCDQVIYVASSSRVLGRTALENALQAERGFVMKRKHLVVLHDRDTLRASATESWRSGRDVERVYPLRRGNGADFARLARFLTGHAVGVVLGGGGARGFAHLGVLRALEEANIPIDLVGGNSMGALIGAQYALEIPLDVILASTRAFAAGGERPAVPVVSLLSGSRMARDLQRMFGDATVDGSWRPFFAAACNLSRARTTVQHSGPLWRAVLASNSPAGLLPPVVHEGDLLVDGAILDNVPVEAMRMRLSTLHERRRGNGSIIAVDVDVRDELCVDPALDRLTVCGTVKSRLTAARRQPGIMEILYRAGHIGGLAQRVRTMQMADFYLQPPVASYPLMAYGRAEDIAMAGYRHAAAEISRWNLHQHRHR